MKHHVRLSVPCAALALMAGLTVGCGSLAPQTQQSAPGFEVEVTAGGLKVPAEVPSGIVTVTYKNSSDAPASPAIGWLNDGRHDGRVRTGDQRGGLPGTSGDG